jgi:hypothetical protein
MHGLTGDLSRFRVRGRIFGIGTPRSHSAGVVFQQVSEKTVSPDRDRGRGGPTYAGIAYKDLPVSAARNPVGDRKRVIAGPGGRGNAGKSAKTQKS